MDMATLAKSIFNHSSKVGSNYLLALFEMMSWYKIKTGKFPDSNLPMFHEIEATSLYLIKMAEDNKLNMKLILNWTGNNGLTLFSKAALYSESLATELLKRNVVVKTLDNLFQIPAFRVS